MKRTQNQRLLAYLRKNRKGITTIEAMKELGICRLSERIREIETMYDANGMFVGLAITRTREKASGGATVTRYKRAR